MEYLEENIDFPPEQDADVIELYNTNKKIYLVLLIIIFGINIACSTISLLTTRSVLYNILTANQVYEIPDFFVLTVNTFLSVDIVIFTSVFITGMISYRTNKSNIFNTHSVLAIFSMVCVIFLSYVHQIYLLAFIIRILFYVYIRYMISLLHSILLQPISQRDGERTA